MRQISGYSLAAWAVLVLLAQTGLAGATVVKDAKPANPSVEAGGHRVKTGGPKHISCSHYGVEFAQYGGMTAMNSASWAMYNAFSFRGVGGRPMLMPLGDSGITCMVSPERAAVSADRKASPGRAVSPERVASPEHAVAPERVASPDSAVSPEHADAPKLTASPER
jgi:hypothetical protein